MMEPDDLPPPFPEYEITGVGTVIAHEGDSYIVRMIDGRVCGFRASSGTPNETDATSDIATPQPAPTAVVILSPLEIRTRMTTEEKIALDTSTDPYVIVVRNDMIAAGEVRSDDPRAAEGKAILIDRGIITESRADEIFS